MSVHRLLLVDDETSLLRLMERYLRRVGYEVDSCPSARSGCETFEAGPDQYSAVIVDMNLPDMSGDELLSRIRKLRPDVAAVICSGAWAPVNEHGPAPTCFLQKPFLPSMLAKAVKSVIG